MRRKKKSSSLAGIAIAEPGFTPRTLISIASANNVEQTLKRRRSSRLVAKQKSKEPVVPKSVSKKQTFLKKSSTNFVTPRSQIEAIFERETSMKTVARPLRRSKRHAATVTEKLNLSNQNSKSMSNVSVNNEVTNKTPVLIDSPDTLKRKRLHLSNIIAQLSKSVGEQHHEKLGEFIEQKNKGAVTSDIPKLAEDSIELTIEINKPLIDKSNKEQSIVIKESQQELLSSTMNHKVQDHEKQMVKQTSVSASDVLQDNEEKSSANVTSDISELVKDSIELTVEINEPLINKSNKEQSIVIKESQQELLSSTMNHKVQDHEKQMVEQTSVSASDVLQDNEEKSSADASVSKSSSQDKSANAVDQLPSVDLHDESEDPGQKSISEISADSESPEVSKNLSLSHDFGKGNQEFASETQVLISKSLTSEIMSQDKLSNIASSINSSSAFQNLKESFSPIEEKEMRVNLSENELTPKSVSQKMKTFSSTPLLDAEASKAASFHMETEIVSGSQKSLSVDTSPLMLTRSFGQDVKNDSRRIRKPDDLVLNVEDEKLRIEENDSSNAEEYIMEVQENNDNNEKTSKVHSVNQETNRESFLQNIPKNQIEENDNSNAEDHFMEVQETNGNIEKTSEVHSVNQKTNRESFLQNIPINVIPVAKQVKLKVPTLKKLNAVKQTRVEKTRNEDLFLPRSQLKGILQHYSSLKWKKEAIEVAEDVFADFFKQLCYDMDKVCETAGRKTVLHKDLERLMKKQGFITKDCPLHILIEEMLPMEYRNKLIPCAKSVLANDD